MTQTYDEVSSVEGRRHPGRLLFIGAELFLEGAEEDADRETDSVYHRRDEEAGKHDHPSPASVHRNPGLAGQAVRGDGGRWGDLVLGTGVVRWVLMWGVGGLRGGLV